MKGHDIKNVARRCRAAMTLAAMIAAVVLGTTESHAQWTVTYLHPPGAAESHASGTSGTQQAGSVRFPGGRGRAVLWSSSALSWVDLSPTGATDSSGINGISDANQVGTAYVGGIIRASLWSGTAASWVDLHPADSNFSVGCGTSGTQQVGWVIVGGKGDYHAALWSGTAASWVDLNPADSSDSVAWGTSGTQQVGEAFVGGTRRASLWSGTASSWVDLNPAHSSDSRAWGTSGTQQVGYANVEPNIRASLWTGTAASWVDLDPQSSEGSVAYATSGTQQVGTAWINGRTRASLWTGTAASWVDLSAFLTGIWGETYATGIWSDGSTTYVVGYGRNLVADRDEALMWTRTVRRNITGIVTLADYVGDNTVPTVTFEIRDVGGSVNLDTETLQLSTDGTYSFSTTAGPGTYDVYCKPSHWLKQRIGSLTISSTGAASVNFTCGNGDCDGDNEVGIGDYAIMSAAYNSALGDANWNVDADLNGDDSVDIADCAILSAAYGNMGD